jgi:pimeloyl-ACP methyl ester carboxylesterase
MKLATRSWPSSLVPAEPTVLLVHGITSSSRTWWRIAPALHEAGWQVLAVDLRCHGVSGCEPLVGVRDAAHDVAETLDAELGRIHVDVAWGHSLGGRTVLQLLNDRPDAANRAVIEDPPGRLTGLGERAANWKREVELARSDPLAFAAEQRAANPAWDERDIGENVASVAACRIGPVLGALNAGLSETAIELAPGIRVPTLLVVAERDSGLPEPDRSETIAALPAGSQLVELPGGHTLHRDVPDAYLRATLGWLSAPMTAPRPRDPSG